MPLADGQNFAGYTIVRLLGLAGHFRRPAVAGRMDLPVVVMGADCAVLGAAAVTETGAPAYCARQNTQDETTVWSIQPERLRTQTPSPPPG